MRRSIVLVALVGVGIGLGACQPAAPPVPEVSPEAQQQAMVERGRYLTTFGGCHDCHTPKVMGPQGPEPDMTRMLSGHPADVPIAPVPDGVLSPGGWVALTNVHLTAWVGPWG